ncbi:hypothetical protein AOXY_G38313 [Acipenser oxyrinchus oxyrinchus]|uniref:Uncharacterized protein n=1 Tax=Acipenser oxyrinchus oxyrinchus TaxID=40147 RepID=A0AAD8CE85_ACIOX|nr:hypothetical protein AOXY_G38313 [Acipenser oxyrinchus oxyrinchus]
MAPDDAARLTCSQDPSSIETRHAGSFADLAVDDEDEGLPEQLSENQHHSSPACPRPSGQPGQPPRSAPMGRYAMKGLQFHYEAHKNNELVRGLDQPALQHYRQELLAASQHRSHSAPWQ